MTLATLRKYNDPALATHDHEILARHGIDSSVDELFGESVDGAQLIVQTSDLDEAKAILEGYPSESPRPLHCPSCGGEEVEARKPLTLVIAIIGTAAAGLLLVANYRLIGTIVFAATLVALLVSSRVYAAFRCATCERRWGSG